MKELVVLSGKGGTGKTSLMAALAAIAINGVLCDADVDAADLHLLMAPNVKQRTDFMGGNVAVIDSEKCTMCGQCVDLCRFDAINDSLIIDEIACEGCGVCVDLCLERAIDFSVKKCGEWYISDTRFGAMVHARLGIERLADVRKVPIVGKVPFDPHFTKAMVQGKTIFEYDQDSDLSRTITQLWASIRKYLET